MGVTRDTLKEGTREAHRRLDETALVAGLVEGSLTTGQYTALLRVYHNFFHTFEAAIKQHHPDLVKALGSFRFEKTRWLTQDLDTLEASASPADSSGIKVEASTFTIPSSPAAIAGCLYVVEGSTLGGMHLSKSGKAFPSNAGRFYEGYGEETVPAWKSFIAWLEETVVTPSDRETALHTAEETFAWFEQEFRQHAEA